MSQRINVFALRSPERVGAEVLGDERGAGVDVVPGRGPLHFLHAAVVAVVRIHRRARVHAHLAVLRVIDVRETGLGGEIAIRVIGEAAAGDPVG
jgi:hypothetical protein